MSSAIIQERVIGVLSDVSGIDKSAINATTDIETDLAIDSLGIVEIQLALEKEFGCSAPIEEVENLRTVGDVFGFIERKLR